MKEKRTYRKEYGVFVLGWILTFLLMLTGCGSEEENLMPSLLNYDAEIAVNLVLEYGIDRDNITVVDKEGKEIPDDELEEYTVTDFSPSEGTELTGSETVKITCITNKEKNIDFIESIGEKYVKSFKETADQCYEVVLKDNTEYSDFHDVGLYSIRKAYWAEDENMDFFVTAYYEDRKDITDVAFYYDTNTNGVLIEYDDGHPFEWQYTYDEFEDYVYSK